MAEIIDDYSEYEPTDYEQYLALRRDRKTLKYDFFSNRVTYNREERALFIRVDGSKEYSAVYEMLEREAKREAEETGKPVVKTYLGYDEETEEYRQEHIQDNERWWSNLTEKYEIYLAEGTALQEHFNKDHPDIPVQPLINLFSGKAVSIRLGEGILDFVYADFETPFEKLMEGLSILSYLQDIGKQHRKKHSIPEAPPHVEKIYNREQLLVEDYYAFYDTFTSVFEVAYESLYSAICPPLYTRSDSLNFREAERYGEYLLELQKEYRELLEFCYDEDFYPELLKEMGPSERYALYREVHRYPAWTERTEFFELNHWFSSGEKMPYGMEKEQEHERFRSAIRRDDKDYAAFCEQYDISAAQAKVWIGQVKYISVSYIIGSVADMLQLEFTKMLEENIRFRKCKRCGRYFIMKGNYNTNFCDRIDLETGKTCKELGAIDNYKKKMEENAAIPLYQKYYKRYAARVKVRQIKEVDFKKWKYEAVLLRDECCEGRISLEEYEEWLYGSFSNRTKK